MCFCPNKNNNNNYLGLLALLTFHVIFMLTGERNYICAGYFLLTIVSKISNIAYFLNKTECSKYL